MRDTAGEATGAGQRPAAGGGYGRLAPKTARDRLIVGLDLPSRAEAEAVVAALGDTVGFYKIGFELVLSGGLGLAEALIGAGKRVFLDMKLLDIDNTVAAAVAAAGRLGADFLTIHAYPAAMAAAVAGRGAGRGAGKLGLLGVSVLTSMDDADLAAAGYSQGAADLVAARAEAARAAGMDGLVCSAREAARVRALVGPDLLLVTPGIRLAERRDAGGPGDDQKRVATPEAAIRDGADYLVVGRPIVAAADRRDAAERFVAAIEAGLG